jgi:hypothetical protein
MKRKASEEDFPVDQGDGLKTKKVNPFSAKEDIVAMHAIQVGADYFGRWVVTIIDLDKNEITKLYEPGCGAKVGY